MIPILFDMIVSEIRAPSGGAREIKLSLIPGEYEVTPFSITIKDSGEAVAGIPNGDVLESVHVDQVLQFLVGDKIEVVLAEDEPTE